jgi:hypothetical protein
VNVSQTDNPAIPAADPSASAATSPNWEQITRDITCPLCGYNLRGLTTPVCPECGHHFDWPAVLNPDQNIHPYLFEHHPRRNVSSFLKTFFGQFEPFKFWQKVKPTQPIRIGRLWAYWAICTVVCLLPALLVIAIRIRMWISLTASQPSLPAALHHIRYLIAYDGTIRGVLVGCLLWAIFPLLTFLSLRVFAQSMRRAKVKPAHVFRCAIYCGDIILWNALFELGAIGLFAYNGWRISGGLAPALLIAGFVVFLVNGGRLSSAYRNYMKFDHVIATVFASQLMVALAIVALLANALWMI